MSQTLKKVTAARPLAPEDLRPGVYVAVLREKSDHTCLVEGGCDIPLGEKRVRFRCVETPEQESNPPLFVEAVCLPFALVRDACGARRTLDVRRVDLFRLRRAYGEFAFARLSAPVEQA